MVTILAARLANHVFIWTVPGFVNPIRSALRVVAVPAVRVENHIAMHAGPGIVGSTLGDTRTSLSIMESRATTPVE